MLVKTIKSTLEGVDGINKVVSGIVAIDKITAPFAYINFESRECEQALNGVVHHYTDTINIEFIAETVDECHALYDESEARFRAMTGTVSDFGDRIISIDSCSAPTPDVMDLDNHYMRRTMELVLEWIPV